MSRDNEDSGLENFFLGAKGDIGVIMSTEQEIQPGVNELLLHKREDK